MQTEREKDDKEAQRLSKEERATLSCKTLKPKIDV
jgi:hypothetical protein